MGRIESLQEQVTELEAMADQAEHEAQTAEWELGDVIKTIQGI